MAVITGKDEICSEICEALGFDPSSVKMLNIHMHANKIVTIVAKIYPDKDGVKQFPAIFKKYYLVEKPEKEKES